MTRLLFCLSTLFFAHSLIYGQVKKSKEIGLYPVTSVSNSERVSDIDIHNDKVYIASKNGISQVTNSGSNPVLSDGEATALKVSSTGAVLAGLVDNTIYIDSNRIFQFDNDTIQIKDIEEYDGDMYVGTTDGVFVFDIRRKVLKNHINKRNSKLETNRINFVYADMQNRLWIGTEKGIIYKKGIEKSFSQNYDKQLNYIAIAENKEGVWLIADKKMWLVNATDNQWVDAGLNKGLHSGKINDLVVDKDGKIYIASNILVKFDPYKNVTEQYSNLLGIASKKCLSLACDEDNIIWLGTDNAGLFQIRYDEVKDDALLISSIVEKPVSCKGESDGKVSVAVSGGTPPYSYKWNNVLLRGDSPSSMKAGKYTVMVTDSKGRQQSLDITLDEPKGISLDIASEKAASSASKRDGECTIKVNGGTSPYDIKWDNGETGPTASKLIFGLHSLTITDANGCSVEENVEISKSSGDVGKLDGISLQIGQKMRLDNLYFKADSSDIQENSIEALEQVYAFLYKNNTIVIEIGGHTNGIPPHEYCDRLSESRAKNVAEYLIKRGIPKERVTYKGYGKREPLTSNKTQAGRRKNQRVEMKIIGITER